MIATTIALASCSEGSKVESQDENEEATQEEVAAPESSADATAETIKHHLDAFGSGDMEALMSDYTEESVVLTPNGMLSGLEQIQGLFESMGPMFPKEGTDFALDTMIVDNDMGFIVWHATTPVVSIPLGTDTYVVLGGKIMRQSFAAQVIPVATEAAAAE